MRDDLPEKWAKRDWDRLTREHAAAIRRAEELARENGLLRAQIRWQGQDREELIRGLQRKVAKQARVIRRHEQRHAEPTNLPSGSPDPRP